MYSVNATKGYGMSAEVVTAYEITKIEFLTWTDKNGRDDLVVSKGTNLKRIKSVAGGTVYSDACKISVADHGNQRDIYHNAVRIYESNGKTTEIKLKDADLRAAAGGNCGSNLTWRLSGSGDNLSLYIEGTGAMPDNWVEDQADASLHAPWYASRKNIRHVYLSDGITSIGNYAFAGMPITELVLPDSVAVIGMGACLDCAGLKGFFFGMTTNVVGVSMEPTLYNGQQIFIDRFFYVLSSPKRGDVVVFLPNGNENSHYYVKRVVAVPGDRLVIQDGTLFVNGIESEWVSAYISDPGIAGNEFTLENGEYFCVGDNPGNSEDSRSANIGPVVFDAASKIANSIAAGFF